MVTVWLGALLVIAGVLYMAAQPLWRGRLSALRGTRADRAAGTLEPERPARGFGFSANWPGLALIGLGAILLLAGAMFERPG